MGGEPHPIENRLPKRANTGRELRSLASQIVKRTRMRSELSIQGTVVYSEPRSIENYAWERARILREPRELASHLGQRTIPESEPGHQENQIGRRADVVRELSMEASYAG